MVTTVSNISLKTARDEYSRGQFVFPKVPASDGDDLNLLTPWRDDDKRGQPFAGKRLTILSHLDDQQAGSDPACGSDPAWNE